MCIPEDIHHCYAVLKAFSVLFWVSVLYTQLGDRSRTSYIALLNGSSSPLPLLFSHTLWLWRIPLTSLGFSLELPLSLPPWFHWPKQVIWASPRPVKLANTFSLLHCTARPHGRGRREWRIGNQNPTYHCSTADSESHNTHTSYSTSWIGPSPPDNWCHPLI